MSRHSTRHDTTRHDKNDMTKKDIFTHIISPFELAQEVYDKERCDNDFFSTMIWYMEYGFVISTPTYFAMFRPVALSGTKEEIVGDKIFYVEDCDCWHFQVVAGDMSQIFHYTPFDLDMTSYEKRNQLRILDKASILRVIRNSVFTKND